MTLAELIYRCTQLIKHIYIDQRIQLKKILSPEGVKCICGKYVLKSEKICAHCHRFVDLNGNFTESMICPDCGSYVRINVNFCNKCGCDLKKMAFETGENMPHIDTVNQPTETKNSFFDTDNNENGAINTKKCITCGKALEEESLFCDYCGTKQVVEGISTAEIKGKKSFSNKSKDKKSCINKTVAKDVKSKHKKEKKIISKEELKNNPYHMAIISLVLGIISWLSMLTIVIPIIAAPIGIITGFKGKKSDKKKMSIVGIILNIGIIVLYILAIVFG